MNAILFLTQILPLIQLAVHIVEQLFPPKSGNEKMQTVLKIVSKVAEKTPGLIADAQQLRDAAKPIIEDAVKQLNSVKDSFKFPGQE